MNYGLKDKVVVISGGTSGIGLATARLAAKDGAQVFLIGRSEEMDCQRWGYWMLIRKWLNLFRPM